MLQLTNSVNSLLPGTAHALIDVRSETEFEHSGIPGFTSLPLLYQDERSQVGICYKTQGQAAAMELGQKLVGPHRLERVKAWGETIQASASKKGIIMCWRGGLRSQIATQWIREAGFDAEQLPGGYKRIRQAFLALLNNPPPLVILAGPTGSGKTELLNEFQNHALDLEGAAHHRGSAFGEMTLPQPSQTRFENHVALALLKKQVLVEDESRMLGRLCIPEAFYQAMIKAPMLHLETSLEERVQRIFEEYVALPLSQGLELEDLQIRLLGSLDKLKRRLDKDYPEIRELLLGAFSQQQTWENHRPWIEAILVRYYDRLYAHSIERNKRLPVWSGDRPSCRAWLIERLNDRC